MMIHFRSIQVQILFAFLVLLITVQCVLFYSIYQSNLQAQEEQKDLHLNTAKAVLENQLSQRRKYLSAFALTVAKDFGLKQALSEDYRSFVVALNNHRQRIEADLTLALDQQGKLIAKLTYDKNTKKTRAERSTSLFSSGHTVLPSKAEQLFHQSHGQIYQTILVPLRSGAKIIAWIGFGFALDAELAGNLAVLTGMDVDLAWFRHHQSPPQQPNHSWQLFATSNPAVSQNNHSDSLYRPVPEAGNPDYVSTWRPVGQMGDKTIVAILYDSKNDLLATLEKRWFHILLVVLGTFSFSVIAAYLLSRNIAQPLRVFAEKTKLIALGDSGAVSELNRKDELGILASEFNLMNKAISERQEKLNFLAYHSDLTRLPNKKKLSEDIDRHIQNQLGPFCLIRFKIAEFDDLNYSLGIDTGEELQIAASRLLADYKHAAAFYQLSASEFASVLPLSEAQANEKLSKIMIEQHEGLFPLRHISVLVHSFSGFCHYPKHGNTARELIHNAGIALQEALTEQIPTVEFTTQMANLAVQRIKLINDLPAAILNGQLMLYYQPKLNLSTKKTDKAEALVAS